MSDKLPDNVISSIELLLQRCLSKEQEWMVKLGSFFQREAIISQGCAREVEQKVNESGQVDDAIRCLCQEIRKTFGISQFIVKACEKEEFPDDKRLAKLLKALVSSTSAEVDCFLWLLKSWDDLLSKQSEVSDIINASWPAFWQESKEDEGTEWPLLLLFMLSEEPPDSVTQCTRDLRRIIDKDATETPSQEDKISETEEQSDDAIWFSEFEDSLIKNYGTLKGKVEHIWPGETELVVHENWPTSMLSKIGEESEKPKLKKFISYTKVAELTPWINKNSKQFREKKDAILSIVRDVWPEEYTRLSKNWPTAIKMHCMKTNEPEKVLDFVKAAKIVLSPEIEPPHALSEAQLKESEDSANSHQPKIDSPLPDTPAQSENDDDYELISESNALLAWLEERKPLLACLQGKLQECVDSLFKPDENVGKDEKFPDLLIRKLQEEKDESLVTAKILAIQENTRQIQLDWLKKNEGTLGNLKSELQHIIDSFDDKNIGTDPEFPALLIKKLKEGREVSHVIKVIQEIVEKNTSQAVQTTSRQREMLNHGSPVDCPVLSDEEAKRVKDAHVVEFRVFSVPKCSKMVLTYRGGEQPMTKKDKQKYFSCELWIRHRPRLEYHYRFKEIFVGNSSEPEFSRFYTAHNTEGRSTVPVCDVVGRQDWVEPILHKFLPHGEPIHDAKCQIVQDILGWMNSVSSRSEYKNSHITNSLLNWTKNILDQPKIEHNLRVIIGCAVAIVIRQGSYCAQNKDLLDQTFQLLQVQGKTTDVLQKITEYFPEEERGGRVKLADLSAAMTHLLCCKTATPSFLSALPLYWLLCNKGNMMLDRDSQDVNDISLETRCYLPNANSKLWGEKMEDWSDHQKQGYRDLDKMKPVIMKLSQDYPWILKSYLFFLSGKTLICFLKDQRLADSISFDLLLMKFAENLKFVEDNDIEKILTLLGNSRDWHKDRILSRRNDMIYAVTGKLQLLLNNLKPNFVDIGHGRGKLTFRSKSYIVLFCLRTVQLLTDMHRVMPDDVKTKYKTPREVPEQFSGVVDLVCEYILQSSSSKNESKDQIQLWDEMLKLEWRDSDFQNRLRKAIRKVIAENTQSFGKNTEESFLTFYTHEIIAKDLAQILKDVYEEVAMECFKNLLKKTKKDGSNGFQIFKNNKLMKFCNKFLRRVLTEIEAPNLLLQWQYSVEFLQAFYHEKFARFDTKIAKTLKQQVDVFRQKANKVLEGKMIRSDFEKLENHHDVCKKLWNCIREEEDVSSEDFEMKLKKWCIVLNEYEEKKKQIQIFLAHCREYFAGIIVVDAQDLEEKIGVDVASKPLNVIEDIFCDTFAKDEATCLKQNVTLKGNTYYERQCRALANELQGGENRSKPSIPWREVIVEIIHPALDKVQEVSRKLQEGTLLLRVIPDVFQQKESDEKTSEYITQQLEHFLRLQEQLGEKLDVDTRGRQIFQFFSLKTARKAVKCLIQTKEVLKLDGDFSLLKHFDDAWLEKDLDHLPRVPTDMQSFKAEDIPVLEAFVQEKDLILWLMKETKGVKDIITLGELARSSARDGQELDKILALQSSVEGYSKLIYHKTDTSAEELTAACKAVFDYSSKNKDLLENWKIAGEQVQWIKELVEIFGESGKLAMEVIREINDFGLYTIRRIDRKVLTLNDYIELKLTKTQDSAKRLPDLHDLQSRIMLITGEKHEEQQIKQVELFVKLLGAVENLAQVCIDLSKAGCLLFEDLSITIGKRTDETNEPVPLDIKRSSEIGESGGDSETSSDLINARETSHAENPTFTITISLNKKAKKLMGIGGFSEIQEIITSLKEVLSRWNSCLNRAYAKYYYLNEFSNEQITYLCKELGKSQITELSDQAKMLLEKVHCDFSMGLINSLLRDAMKEPAQAQMHVIEGQAGQDVKSEIEQWKEAVRKLHFEEEIEEKIAKASVAAVGTDIEECVWWAYTNGNNEMEINTFLHKFEEKTASYYEKRDIQANFEILHARVNKTMEDILESLQRNLADTTFANSIMTLYEAFTREAGSQTMDGLLNIEHLGRFLVLFGEQRHKNNVPNRSFAQFAALNSGKPNIVICSEHETPAVCLHLYASDSSQPLPTTSEILLCNENTGEEEVKRFFRRALYKCSTIGSPIFCLAAAQKLSHRISEVAGNLFHEIIRGDSNKAYQLVIISSDQRHMLSTCFNQKHQAISAADSVNLALLRQYLKDKLETEMPWDLEESVKIVYSHRSGLGKSLYIERLKQKARHACAPRQIHFTTVRYMEKVVKPDLLTESLCGTDRQLDDAFHFIHLDMTPAIQTGLLQFTFNLLILGSIEDSMGRIWRRKPSHFYAVELTHFKEEKKTAAEVKSQSPLLKIDNIISYYTEFLRVLPNVCCLSPREILENPQEGISMDEKELCSEHFQRPLQYLKAFDEDPNSFVDFKFNRNLRVNKCDCIKILLKHCSIKNPSWSQLHHFANFLNMQLGNYETSIFFKDQKAKKLIGLKAFVIRFIIKMAQDFATPSVNMEDVSAHDAELSQEEEYRRTWEKPSLGPGERHPFVFFTKDGESLIFIDVHTNEAGDVVNVFGDVLVAGALRQLQSRDLPKALKEQGIAINEKSDELTRKERLRVLCKVMGIPIKERKISGRWMNCLRKIDQSGKISVSQEGDGAWDTFVNFVGGNKQTFTVVDSKHLPILEQCKKYGVVDGNKFVELEKLLENITKVEQVRREFGLEFTPTEVPDPDNTYELSTNNVMKILAIYMRFLCNIPVIIVGETGCGKTRMIKFMSDLLKAKNGDNLMALRVHGGVTVSHIHDHVREAREKADKLRKTSNAREGVPHAIISSVILFFDEANTTEAIYAIKEAICDSIYDDGAQQLWIVAACNPYKTLSETAIKKLANAGLGYRVKTVQDNSGPAPMHALVYRVVAIPPSMQPFMWDFGQLGHAEETSYIKQMVIKLGNEIGLRSELQHLIMDIFSYTHRFMRKQEGECKYVSLRDVERCIVAYKWFYNNAFWLCRGIQRMKDMSGTTQIRKAVEHQKSDEKRNTSMHMQEKPSLTESIQMYLQLHMYKKPDLTESIQMVLQVLGLCYHSSLEDRENFREEVARFFRLRVPKFSHFKASDFLEDLEGCQKFIVSHMEIGDDIAPNKALLENVYMIAICAELKIPLFLIGKPGSSKSLAKTIVSRSLLGFQSTKSVCRKFKAIDVTSFQCSALTQADGIKKVFDRCAEYQLKKDRQRPNKYVSVVALDEIGLAEDSPHMPLKILHALLESGSVIDSDLANKNKPTKKLGFLGISNWALDPAKMNRGVFVTRGVPDEDELLKTTDGIFHDCDSRIKSEIDDIIKLLIKIYLNIVEQDSESEYFGLRDLYSMMKMVKASIMHKKWSRPLLTLTEVMNALVTNFSGGRMSHSKTFENSLVASEFFEGKDFETLSIVGILERNLSSCDRHLLLLTKEHFPLNLVKYALSSKEKKIQVVYGSAFPGDNNNAALCRNVNKIKACMETECIAIILNLRKIYESLYDALNQHYVTLGNKKYVDIGLGSSESRIKCRVHDKFRMIFIENAETVYKEYPVPLINRLEKHHFNSEMFLKPPYVEQAEMLKTWMESFVNISPLKKPCFDINDVFTGFHEHFANAVIFVLINHHSHCDSRDSVQKKSVIVERSQKRMVLLCATIDSVVRLSRSSLIQEADELQKEYFENQNHEDLQQFLDAQVNVNGGTVKIFDITTYSTILMEHDRWRLEQSLFPESQGCIVLLSLQSFETLQQFSEKLDDFFAKGNREKEKKIKKKILLIQCSSAHKNMELISCARYCLESKIAERNLGNDSLTNNLVMAFLLSTKRQHSSNTGQESLILQHTLSNEIVYVDELCPTYSIGPVSAYLNDPIGKIFRKGLQRVQSGCTGSQDALDLKLLLNNYLCEALSPLRSCGERTEGRVRILKNSLKDENFTRTLLEHIVSLFEKRDKEMKGQDSRWIADEATDREKLIDAGTFQKAIWLYLKNCLSQALCYIISIIDENANLDLVCSEPRAGNNSWTVELWIKIFKEMEFSWATLEFVQTTSQITEDANKLCFPFSFLFYKEISERWDNFSEDGEERFITSLDNLAIMSPVDNFYSCKGEEVVEMLFQDMTRLAYTPKSREKENEINAVSDLVKNWVSDFKRSEFSSNERTSLPKQKIWKFMNIQRYFNLLSQLFEKWPTLIDCCKNWALKIEDEKDILKFAFGDLVQTLAEEIPTLDKADRCLEWMSEVSWATNVFGSFPECQTVEPSNWKTISLIFLLLTHLSPSHHIGLGDKEWKSYMELISKEAVKVGKAFLNKPKSTGTADGLVVICQRLATCYGAVKLRLLIDWEDAKCGLCKIIMKIPRRLACNHYICEKCLATSNACPTCSKKFERETGNDSDKILTLSDEKSKKLRDFQSNCTSFLLSYLTEFVDDQKALNLILEQAIGGINPTSKLNMKFIDLDLNVLTVILKRAFEISGNEAVTIIDKHLSQGSLSPSIRDLVSALLLYFESLVSHNTQIDDLKQSVVEIKKQSKFSTNMLEHIAKLRCGIANLATKMNQEIQADGSISEETFRKVLPLFKSNEDDFVRMYFTNYGCERFGINWALKIKDSQFAKALIPSCVLDSIQPIDLWQMLGDQYTQMMVRSTMSKSLPPISSDFEQFCTIGKLSHVFAFFSLAMRCQDRAKKFDQDLKMLCGKKPSLTSDIRKVLRLFQSAHVQGSHCDRPLMQLLVMTSVAMWKQPYLMSEFKLVLQNPEETNKLFLPSMPESLYFSVPTEYRAKKQNFYGDISSNMFACPNGHMYMISECTRPQERRKCPVCDENIGGRGDKLDQGNVHVEVSEESQAGYILDKEVPQQHADDPHDRMSRHGVAVTRFILHSCLLFAVYDCESAVAKISRAKNRSKDCFISYLLKLLRKNIDDLALALHKSRDDAQIVMYNVLQYIVTSKIKNSSPRQNPPCNWSTIDSRREWEKCFRETFLHPVIKNLEANLSNGWNRLREEGELHRLRRDVDSERLDSAKPWSDPMLWRLLKHVNFNHLLQHIKNSARSRTVILRELLMRPRLQLSGFLMPVLELQSTMIKRYCHSIELNEAEKPTFATYLLEEGNDPAKRELIENYFTAWEKTLACTWLDETSAKLSMNSPVTLALPSRGEQGRRAKLFTETLIGLHNEFLERANELIPGLKLEEVSIPNLQKSHIVLVNLEKDLQHLMEFHTKYDVQYDDGNASHKISFNLEAFETLAREKYIRHKKLIKVKTLPLMRYSHDTGIREDLRALKNLILQERLSPAQETEVDAKIEAIPPTQHYEGVRILSHALSFLVKTSSSSERSLKDYMTDTLAVDQKLLSVIPLSAQIKHTFALYLYLTWRKAVEFARQGIDPYQHVLPQGQREIPLKLMNEVKAAFKSTNIIELQKRINEFLVTNVDCNLEWSLVTDIFPHAEYLDEDEKDKSWYEKLPKELLFCHIAHLFRITVEIIDLK